MKDRILDGIKKSKIFLKNKLPFSTRYKILYAILLLACSVGIIYYMIISGQELIAATIINGIFLGGLYGLTAMGLSLVFGVTKIINVAHGEFLVLSAYLTFWIFTLYGTNLFISAIFSALSLFIIGIVLGKFLMNPALKGGLDPPLLVSFGLSLCLRNLMRLFWTATPRGVLIRLGGVYLPGDIYVSGLSMVIITTSIIGLIILHLFLKKTYAGKAIRATAMDRDAASLMGISVSRINALSYAIGLLLAGVAGSLISIKFSFDPEVGHMFLGKSMCVVVLGGVGHILGAIAGGLILGIAESIGTLYFGDVIREAVAYLIFLCVLLLKPTGLLAKYRAF